MMMKNKNIWINRPLTAMIGIVIHWPCELSALQSIRVDPTVACVCLLALLV